MYYHECLWRDVVVQDANNLIRCCIFSNIVVYLPLFNAVFALLWLIQLCHLFFHGLVNRLWSLIWIHFFVLNLFEATNVLYIVWISVGFKHMISSKQNSVNDLPSATTISFICSTETLLGVGWGGGGEVTFFRLKQIWITVSFLKYLERCQGNTITIIIWAESRQNLFMPCAVWSANSSFAA